MITVLKVSVGNQVYHLFLNPQLQPDHPSRHFYPLQRYTEYYDHLYLLLSGLGMAKIFPDSFFFFFFLKQKVFVIEYNSISSRNYLTLQETFVKEN